MANSQIKSQKASMEDYFQRYARNIIGQNLSLDNQAVVYADWTASGRLYQPIERYLSDTVGPWVANTHTESNATGSAMTRLYHQARSMIKKHVNASSEDVLIGYGAGMTAVVNKLQRVMGLRNQQTSSESRPLVIITHMEHHSNQVSWLECDVDLEILQPDAQGNPDLIDLERILQNNQHRRLLIGSFTACSNVTGICTPYFEMAELMHRYQGYCLVDFAASAPYVEINMHPPKVEQRLDAVMFSPHKFLGGPGSSGILVFNAQLYRAESPDLPGGGTVAWTNPWGQHQFFEDIELREDGGTPPFLQTIKAALAIQLKEAMGLKNIEQRERELVAAFWAKMTAIENLHLLAENRPDRLPIFSFWIEGCHHNMVVKLLNDRFGIQARGGCSCAGTYGHILLGVDKSVSQAITCEIDQGDLSRKPGWVRISFHPTTTDVELAFIAESVQKIADNYEIWQQEYRFHAASGEFIHKTTKVKGQEPNLTQIEFHDSE